MPVLGTGVMPAGGAGSLGQELQYIVRRAFVKKLVVQIYNTSPLTAALIANSQPASGGVSSVTIPAQGAQFVNMQWVGYDGSFSQPAVQPGRRTACASRVGIEREEGYAEKGQDRRVVHESREHNPRFEHQRSIVNEYCPCMR